ncbi:MAG: hypothetical protein ACKO5F_11050 [Synechococcus sp.]
MTEPTPIRRHPVAQVQQESGLSRSAFYKRMNQAGVVPTRIGQNSFLSPEQVQALAGLEDHIQAGGNPETFPGRLQTPPEVDLALLQPETRFPQVPAPAEEAEEDQEAPEELVAAAVLHLDGLLSFLTKAARNSWELPTSQVQLLVGAKPRGTTFSRYGFTFRPAGKHGQETSWRVSASAAPRCSPASRALLDSQ